VIAEEKFKRRAPGFVNFLGFTFNHHAGHGHHAARGNEFARTVLNNLHETDEAGGQRPNLLQVTQRWDLQTELSSGLENGGSRFNLDHAAIYGDGETHFTSTAS
jgi:hypothetical protein